MNQDEKQPEQEPQPPRLHPQIWVGSLADYNAGWLHGDWCDAAVDDEQLRAEVQAILDTAKEPGAEEWAIFDYDEFGAFKVGEYEDLRVVAAVARGIAEHGQAYSVWAELHDADPDMLTQFEDAYIGHYESVEDWAREVMEEGGLEATLDQTIPDSLRSYVQIDYAGWARDAELEGGMHVEEAPGGGVYLFRVQ